MVSIMNKYTIVILFPIIFLINGCSLKIPHSPNVSYSKHVKIDSRKTKLLVKRFIEYWDSRIKGDAQKAWKYELPYQRYMMNFDLYKRLIGMYKNAKIELSAISFRDKNTAIIERKISVHKKIWKKKDKWIYVQDNWYHKFYQSIFPPKTEEEAKFQ